MARIDPAERPARPVRAFGAVDRYFLALRLLVTAGALVWLMAAPMGALQRRAGALVFVGYLLSTVGLYVAILVWPRPIRHFYLLAVLADSSLVYLLVRFVGENRGSYFIMFYLLIAVSSFYFGTSLGMGIAGLTSLLYTQIYLADPQPVYGWSDLILRVSFFLLTAVSLGFLSEREKRDKTRIKELNEELTRKNDILEQAYRHLSLGRLSAGIAENINNPTSILLGRVNLMLAEARQTGLPESVIKDLEVVARNAHRVGMVARSLLAFATPQAFDPRPLNINQIIEDALVLMESDFERRRIVIRKELQPVLPRIRGDREGLQEIVLNLLSNALDALPEGGTIRISTRLNGGPRGAVECVVADDGAGIPQEHMERIFEPFFSTKSNRGGVGLGLSTTLRIMKQHGGLIRAANEPGSGAVFTMTFPIAEP